METHAWLGDEGAAGRFAVDHTFAFQQGQRLACGHAADSMVVGQLPLGGQSVWSQLLSGDAVTHQGRDRDVPGVAGGWFRGGEASRRLAALANQLV